MGIRQPAAEKLVRQLLELRLTRLTALSDEFIATMGNGWSSAFVDMDERRQRTEILNQCPTPHRAAALDGTTDIADIYQEDFEESWPYCTCDLEPYEEEEASNICSACGKLLS
jgi:hypothetical protein